MSISINILVSISCLRVRNSVEERHPLESVGEDLKPVDGLEGGRQGRMRLEYFSKVPEPELPGKVGERLGFRADFVELAQYSFT